MLRAEDVDAAVRAALSRLLAPQPVAGVLKQVEHDAWQGATIIPGFLSRPKEQRRGLVRSALHRLLRAGAARVDTSCWPWLYSGPAR